MIDIRTAAGEIETLLRSAISSDVMAGYVGEVVEPVPVPPGDVRVKPYWALWAGTGYPDPDRMYPIPSVSYLSFTVTVAGGTYDRTLFGIGLVRQALVGAVIASGLISEPFIDPGPLRLDPSIQPARHYSPLPFQLEP